MMTGDTYRNYISSNGSAVETGWDDNVNMDWQDELMRTALTQNYYLIREEVLKAQDMMRV